MKYLTKILIYLFVILLFSDCANIISPIGGPKDITPPRLIYSNPKMGQVVDTTFNGNIQLNFDEIIVLKDMKNEFFVSPPLIVDPTIKASAYSIKIKLNNSLFPSTTYNLNFNNAVTDINEGNVLKNFHFVFTTGLSIDTMQISGNIFDAFNKKPEEKFIIMLYPENNDSLPFKAKPRYIGLSDKRGRFVLNNVKVGKYKLFALKDNNKNYQYDPIRQEKIAFIDNLVIPTVRDTFYIDTIYSKKKDTIKLKKVRIPYYKPDSIKLYSFNEDIAKQYIKTNKRETRKELYFLLNKPAEKINIKPLNFKEEWAFQEMIGDTAFHFWLSDSTIYQKDSLMISVSMFKTDSLERVVWITDTILFKYKDIKINESKIDYTKIEFWTNLKEKTLNFYDSIEFEFKNPIILSDTSKIKLLKIVNDSTKINSKIKLNQDMFNFKKFYIASNFEQGEKYELIIDSLSFNDFYNFRNDSTNYKFVVNKVEDFGSILLTVTNVTEPLIVQLLNSNGKVIIERFIEKSTVIDYRNLIPSDYSFRIIYDSNENRKWDTGKYIKHIQPERVLEFNKLIKVIKNWDVEESWEL